MRALDAIRRAARLCAALALCGGCGREPSVAPESSSPAVPGEFPASRPLPPPVEPGQPLGESVPTTEPILGMDSGGLRIRVDEPSPGLFEFSIEPTPGAPQRWKYSRADGAVTLDPARGAVILRQNGAIAWQGAFEAIARFGRSGTQGVATAWRAREGEVLYGLGERYEGLDVAGKVVEMWNQDAPGQNDGSASYFTTPVLFSSGGYALFAADNPEGRFDLNSLRTGWHRYERAGRTMTLRVATGVGLREGVALRTQFCGGLRGVPDWVWAPWISRNSYENQGEAEAAIEGMVARGIPLGVVVQEAWKGTSETGEFNSFSRGRWPHLGRYLARCEELGIRNVLWQVPILHPSSPHFREAEARGFFVKTPSGEVSYRRQWLAGFGNVDFTNPEAVAFWKELQRPLLGLPTVAGFKADDGEDVKADDVFHDGRRGWDLHNEYSALYAKALWELMDEEGVEGMLWSRSGSLGIEQAPGLWAGDQYATWEQMASLIPAGLSASISGMPFWGHDIGGYIGDPGPELYLRWAQFGAFSPMMQYHGIEPREPWAFGEDVARIYGRLAHLRMNLRPWLAALGREAVETGLPLMRPMAMEFPEDARFAREQTQYMLGADLLVAPILEPGTGRRISFPQGRWQHLIHPVSVEGPADVDVSISLESVPVFVREGSELAVEIGEDAGLGEWREGLEPRRLSFGPERAILRRLSAPYRADVVAGKAELTFAADELTLPSVAVESRTADGAEWQVHGLVRRGETVAAELATRRGAPMPGFVQPYRVVLRAEAGKPDAVLYEGAVQWTSPAAMEVVPEGSTYLLSGGRTLRTRLANLTDRTLALDVRADVDPTVGIIPSDCRIVLRPHADRTMNWLLELSSIEERRPRRVRFAMASEGIALDETEVVYSPPWRWIVCGPFPMPALKGHRTPLPPEWMLARDVVFETSQDSVRWWGLDAGHFERNDGLDFAEAFGATDQAVAYAATQISSDRAQDAEFWMGSDDTLSVWLNGRWVHDAEAFREAVPGQDRIPVRLAKGRNWVVAKVAQETGAWKLHFAVTGPEGRPIDGLTDAFVEHAAFDPGRSRAALVVPMPSPATWQVDGPFPVGLLDSRLETVGADALDGLNWRQASAPSERDGAIDLGALLGLRESAEAFARLELDVERRTPVEIRCGSDDGITLWLNGRELLDAQAPRAFRPGENVVRASLKRGRNRLACRIRQAGGDWKFRVEVWDASVAPMRPIAR
jgi:alpha-glucosidase (family GH31 glycosyl hydrolase)